MYSFVSRAVLSTNYIVHTHTIDNGFILLLSTVNLITVLNHSLYVSLSLIALMTAIVSIIQWAKFGSVDSEDLFILIRKLQKWCFKNTDVTGYRNTSFQVYFFPPTLHQTLAYLLANFQFETAFQFFFVFFNLMSTLTFLVGLKRSTFPFTRHSFTNDKYILSPILSFLIKFSTTFLGNSLQVAISLYVSNIYIIWKN